MLNTETIRSLPIFYAAAEVVLPVQYTGVGTVLSGYSVTGKGTTFVAGAAVQVDTTLGTVAHYKAYRTNEWFWRTPQGGFGWSKTRREAARQLLVHHHRVHAAELATKAGL